MGACEFMTKAKGKNAQEAFRAARDHAQWESGHGGYTGTIAEKTEFTLIPVPAAFTPQAFAEKMMAEDDPRVDNKWGPAGCVKLAEGEFLFFGWASS